MMSESSSGMHGCVRANGINRCNLDYSVGFQGAAWEKQEGAKAKILLAGILYLLISFIVETCIGAILVATGLPEFGQLGTWHNLLLGPLVNLLMAPLLLVSGFWA